MPGGWTYDYLAPRKRIAYHAVHSILIIAILTPLRSAVGAEVAVTPTAIVAVFDGVEHDSVRVKELLRLSDEERRHSLSCAYATACRAIALADSIGWEGGLARAHAAAGRALIRMEGSRRVREHLEAARALGRKSDQAASQVYAMSGLATLHMRAARDDSARDLIERAQRIANASGDSVLVAYGMYCHASILGSHSDALGYLRQCLELLPSDAAPDMHVLVLCRMGSRLRHLGKPEESRSVSGMPARLLTVWVGNAAGSEPPFIGPNVSVSVVIAIPLDSCSNRSYRLPGRPETARCRHGCTRISDGIFIGG